MSIFISIRLFKGVNMTYSSFSSPAKVEIGANSKQKLPVKLIFSAQNEILDKKISQGEGGNAPKRRFSPQNRPNRTKKGSFGGEIAGRR